MAVALAALAALVALCRAPLSATEPEDELKAAIVLNFLRYSEWPERVPTDAPLTVRVAGRQSLAEVFRRSLDGKSVNGRTVRVTDSAATPDPRCCSVIYVAAAKSAEVKQALAAPHPAHALTIGESDRFLEEGGAVNLLLVDGRMSFEVSLEALDRARVAISSKLLRCGQIRDDRKGRP
jgi:hypothetical protein